MHPIACRRHLDVVFAQPVAVLLKHSASCGLSRWAWDEVAAVAAHHPDLPVYVLEVPHQSTLANAVARRTGVQHESPQVLLLRCGDVIAHASHWAVTAAFLRTKLDAPSTVSPPSGS